MPHKHTAGVHVRDFGTHLSAAARGQYSQDRGTDGGHHRRASS